MLPTSAPEFFLVEKKSSYTPNPEKCVPTIFPIKNFPYQKFPFNKTFTIKYPITRKSPSTIIANLTPNQ
jgi:hypothetical protein